MLGDEAHRHRHAGTVGEREITLGGHRLGGPDLELAGLAALMVIERLLVGEARPFALADITMHGLSSPARGLDRPVPAAIEF